MEPHDGAGFLLLSEPQQLSLLLDSLETRGPREKVRRTCFLHVSAAVGST